MGKGLRSLLWPLPLILIWAWGCSNTQWLINRLPDGYREAFRKIRFIITRNEKKEFLHLTTDSEREEFLERFWKKRDPDPDSPENEFRDQYNARIESATHLFSDEGREGWDTDRGRVYIMLGPPDFRESYPMGYSMYDNPSEVWFYGRFPVVFIDRNRSGSLDLTSLGARYVAQLLKGAELLKPAVRDKKGFYTFKLQAEKESGGKIKLILTFDNRNIYFNSGPDYLYSDIEIRLRIRLKGGEDQWTVHRKRRISIRKNSPGKTSEVIILMNLRKGEYEMEVIVENRENNIRVSRKKKIKI